MGAVTVFPRFSEPLCSLASLLETELTVFLGASLMVELDNEV